MSASEETLPKNLGPYRIQSHIGRGGMGVVYRASDTRLDREVAIKVLPSKYAGDGQSLDRFQREAKAIAALNHPSIVTIHSVEEYQGFRFIVMELVSGTSLSSEVIPGGITLAKLLDLAIPIADAIAVAHRAGVTHRDLKPENIMVGTDGRVKVLDFGLAKFATAEPQEVESTIDYDANVTQQGQVIGTPCYMSPEQAEGREVDGRTDLFSFGIILYELATGVRPFSGDTPMSTLTSVLRDEPVPTTELKPSLPRYFGRIISRCLEKSPDRRYQTALDLRNELEELRKEVSTGELERPVTTPASDGKRLLTPILVAMLVCLVGICAWLLTQGDTIQETADISTIENDTVAVIGFSNINDPADTENLGPILSNLMTSNLSGTGKLKVLSQPKVAYARKTALGSSNQDFDASNAEVVARKAGCGIMVVGTVSQLGEKYVVTAEAIRVEDGTNLVSGRGEANQPSELFALAAGLSDTLREGLGQAADTKSFDAQEQLTESALAYRYYVEGKTLLHMSSYSNAIDKLRQAVEVDSSFAMAFLDLGIALWWEGVPDEARIEIEKGFGYINRLSDEDQKIYRAFRSMLISPEYPEPAVSIFTELEAAGSTNPTVYYLLGECYTHAALSIDFKRAMNLFLYSLKLDPTYRVVFFHLMESYIGSSRVDEGLAFLDELEKDDPTDTGIMTAKATLLMSQGRYEEAIVIGKKLELTGENARAAADCLANSYAALGNVKEMEKYEEQLLTIAKGELRTLEYFMRHGRRTRRGRFLAAAQLWDRSWQGYEGPRDQEKSGDMLHPMIAIEHASNMFQMGKADEGLAVLQLVRNRKDVQNVPQFWLGFYLAKSGNTQEAKLVLEELKNKALQYESTPYLTATIRVLAALIEYKEGRISESRRLVNSLQEIAVMNRRMGVERWLRGMLELASGNKVGAAAALNSIQVPGNNQVVNRNRLPVAEYIHSLYRVAVVEQELGDFSRAREHLGAFLKYWGEADIPLPSVVDAKQRLAELAGR
ncbi:MAG: serine/threonine-protein kinase [Planctomycetota bacterium]|nr:serine/threonine-protein kinase [Planctomycetota bacterium]